MCWRSWLDSILLTSSADLHQHLDRPLDEIHDSTVCGVRLSTNSQEAGLMRVRRSLSKRRGQGMEESLELLY